MNLNENYRVVEKPWGKEEVIEVNNVYCLKKITLNVGCKTSLQYHNKKHETIYIELGKAIATFKIDEKLTSFEVGPGFNVVLSPGQIHRFEALETLVMFEASTPELNDVVRLEDSYNRVG